MKKRTGKPVSVALLTMPVQYPAANAGAHQPSPHEALPHLLIPTQFLPRLNSAKYIGYRDHRHCFTLHRIVEAQHIFHCQELFQTLPLTTVILIF